MLAQNNEMWMVVAVIAAVLVNLGFGFFAGSRCAQRRPFLASLLGFLAVTVFSLGPLGVHLAVARMTLYQSLALTWVWLILSGFAWGVLLRNYRQGKNRSLNMRYHKPAYLIGLGSLLTCLTLSWLAHDQSNSLADIQAWARLDGLFLLTALIYGVLGLGVLWMHIRSQFGSRSNVSASVSSSSSANKEAAGGEQSAVAAGPSLTEQTK